MIDCRILENNPANRAKLRRWLAMEGGAIFHLEDGSIVAVEWTAMPGEQYGPDWGVAEWDDWFSPELPCAIVEPLPCDANEWDATRKITSP